MPVAPAPSLRPLVVAVVGSLMVDMVYETKSDPQRKDRRPAISLTRKTGGKGANIALATHRSSHRKPVEESKTMLREEGQFSAPQSEIRVFMNAGVGDDEVGRSLRQGLRSQGINTEGVLTIKGEETGACTVIVDVDTGESRMVAYDGPRMVYKAGDIENLESLTGSIAAKPDLLMMTLEIPREVIEHLLETAARAGVETVLNPSPKTYLVTEAYANVTHLILNESETAAICDCTLEDLQSSEAQRLSAIKLLGRGVQNVVLTLGQRGAFYAARNGQYGNIPAERDVDVRDTTGAGDSFIGAYATNYLWQRQQGVWHIEEAVIFACKAAARTIRQLGAQESLPWWDEM